MYEDFIYPITLSKKELYSLRNKVTGEQKHLMSFHLDEERSEIWDYFVFTNEDSKVVIKCCKDEETDWQYKATHVETDAGWVSIKLVALAQLYGGKCSMFTRMFDFLKKWFTPRQKPTPVEYDDILTHVLNETWNSDDGTFEYTAEKETE